MKTCKSSATNCKSKSSCSPLLLVQILPQSFFAYTAKNLPRGRGQGYIPPRHHHTHPNINHLGREPLELVRRYDIICIETLDTRNMIRRYPAMKHAIQCAAWGEFVRILDYKCNKLWRRVQNQRKDAIHKITTALVRDYDIICVEDLAVRDLIDRNTFLTRDIKNAMWGEVLRQLEYKAKKYGKTLIKVDRYFPSSQICSACNNRWQKLHDCSIRKWTCPGCGTTHDRDVNAAQNILREGLRIYYATP